MTSPTGPTNKPPTARRAAFTLLELIVVMLILCVTAAMVAPSLRGSNESLTTKNAAAHIVALCHYARTRAITEGRIYRLNIDVKARSCWLTTQKDGADTRLLNDLNQTYTMPEGAALAFNPADIAPASAQRSYIRFFPGGAQDVATLTVTDRAGSTVTLRCDSPTEPFHILTVAELARR